MQVQPSACVIRNLLLWIDTYLWGSFSWTFRILVFKRSFWGLQPILRLKLLFCCCRSRSDIWGPPRQLIHFLYSLSLNFRCASHPRGLSIIDDALSAAAGLSGCLLQVWWNIFILNDQGRSNGDFIWLTDHCLMLGLSDVLALYLVVSSIWALRYLRYLFLVCLLRIDTPLNACRSFHWLLLAHSSRAEGFRAATT